MNATIAKLTHEQKVEKYCDDVTSGVRIAGSLERAMAERYLEDLEKSQEGTFPYYFDPQLANSSCDFFSFLRHTDGEYSGKEFELYPWQAFIVWNLFGWKRRDNGYRRFREAFITVGRGNGKTPFGAALMLLLFGFDSPVEDRAECYTAATKRGQADLSFSAAKRFIERSPSAALKQYVEVLRYNLNIPGNGSKLEPLSSDGKSADGLNIHALLRDELHAWSDHHRDFYEKLETALGKRRQPLAITITTAGSEESHLWREQYEFARKVVERGNNVEGDTLFVAIYEMDDDDDELDEVSWHKANPMLAEGVVKIDHILKLRDKAVIDPTFRSELRRYHCNKFTTSSNRSIPADLWAIGDQALPDLTKRTCHAGVDLGWNDDLAAIGYAWALDTVEIDGEHKMRYAIDVDVWIPRGSRRDLNREPFASWIRKGLVTVTESEWTDTAAMYLKLASRRDQHGVKTIAYDPNNAREFALNCENEIGITTFPFAQNHAKYNEPLKEFKIALSEGRILHGGNPILGWAASNMVEEENTKGHRMPAKDRSTEKIDPIVAVLMAFSECLFAERQRPSVYERRGPLMF